MCTSVTFTNPALYGRNLDLETPFGETLVIAPRSFPFSFHSRAALKNSYALIGMARVESGIPLFADAMNEKGLYMAGLNFPDNAYYFPDKERKDANVAPYELILLVLGTCATLEQAKRALSGICITEISLVPEYPLAQLHWHVADPTGSMTVEPTAGGLRLYDNPAGVLTNNPPFPFQMMNLNNFLALSPRQPENHFSPRLMLRTYGQGMGALGLPGDASPMSRFVRATFLHDHVTFTNDSAKNVVQFFHILDAVAMVRGSVLTPDKRYDQTLYACCMDAIHHTYYYRTYDSGRIYALTLTEEACRGTLLLTYPLIRTPKFSFAGRQEDEA